MTSLIRPAQGLDWLGDLEAAGEHGGQVTVPLCDEAHLQVFSFWYQMGGLQRPLTPVEAAETPAPLAMDFVFLLKRMRSLVDVQAGLDDFIRQGLYRPEAEHGGR